MTWTASPPADTAAGTPTETPPVTAALAQSAHGLLFDDLPRQVRDRVVEAITDGIGVMIAGARDEAGQAIRRYAMTIGGAAQAALVPGGARLPAELAAMVNATSAHSLEYDDISHPAHAHPTAVLLPAALASAQLQHRTGRDLITAYLAGFETMGALGRGMNAEHYRAGWHATSTLGAVGAAATAALLTGCDVGQTEMALGIAASSACGVRGNFGSMTKPLHAGLAAAAAVRAATLARSGWTATPGAIEVYNGFATTFGGAGGARLDHIVSELGERWTILEPYGLAIKKHPCAGGTHAAIDAALAIRDEIGDRAIRVIHIGRPSLAMEVTNHRDPHTREEACFSLEYVVAAALVRGRLLLADLDPSALHDPAVRALMARITQSVDPRIVDSREYGAVVTVDFTDGSRLTHRADVARGKNANPLTEQERMTKFADCVGPGAEQLWEVATRLEDDVGLDRLLTQLAQLPVPDGEQQWSP